MLQDKSWHNLSADQALEAIGSCYEGLSNEETKRRLLQFGRNELAEKKKTPPWLLFLEQFKDFLIIILLAAAIVSAVLAMLGEGDMWDPILIIIIVLFAAILGFVQEYRSGRAMDALRKMTAPMATVIRQGSGGSAEEEEIPSSEIVPGDIIILEAGDRIPADMRLIQAVSMKIDEAPLTGESVPVDKFADPISGDIPIGDRRNMAYMGTTLVYGRGRAVATATGMKTEFGKIAGLLQSVEIQPTPLQINLDKVGKVLGIVCLVICGGVALIGILEGLFESYLAAFIWGVSLAVAAVPEALPAVVTICLALGVQKMSKRNALIRELPAVETLGCTTFICSDKTGTLTQNAMTVKKIYTDGRTIDVSGVGYEPKGQFSVNNDPVKPQEDPCLNQLLRASILCNDSRLVHVDNTWQVRGDPTEGALVVLAAKAGINVDEEMHAPRVTEIPFSSERKRMTTVHETRHSGIAYSKGAPEVILDSCTMICMNGTERTLTESDRKNILEANQSMASSALRVLGLAYKPISDLKAVMDKGHVESTEQEMAWLGLVGMIDPPRLEVKDAIKVCKQAGIQPVMITGDHRLTAEAIAGELGMLSQEKTVLSGNDLDKLSQIELEKVVEKVSVYARVSAEHKMRVVEALQSKSQVVAMTGDGVNDAPALRKADIGIAMGITGTDVSKEAGSVILTDDNFASIVAAVEEGRNIFANIRKFLMFLLSCNSAEVMLMVAAFIAALFTGSHALPLVAVQILVMNLVTDGFPALALAVDPGDPDAMQMPPRTPGKSMFDTSMIGWIFGMGIWLAAVTLGIFLWALDSGKGLVEAQSLCFATLVVLELVMSFEFRSERHSLFKIGPFSNRWLILACLSSFAVLLALVYVPVLQDPFHTYPMGFDDWGIVAIFAGLTVVVFEVVKLVIKRFSKR